MRRVGPHRRGMASSADAKGTGLGFPGERLRLGPALLPADDKRSVSATRLGQTPISISGKTPLVAVHECK